MEVFDFSGYVTKNDLKCSDGRVIRRDAFKHDDGVAVPLVWMHQHNEPDNVLGHAVLENREDGVYAYAKFNSSARAEHSKILVEHGDITGLSIYANQLKQSGTSVLHGAIKEVSLVISGANPGAFIDNVSMAHAEDGLGEAIIYTGEGVSMEHYEEYEEDDTLAHAEEDQTVGQVFNAMTEVQKNVVYAMLAEAIKGEEKEESVKHSDGGEQFMKKNVFENEMENNQDVLSHSDMKSIFESAKQVGSLKEAVLAHAGTYGIDNIDVLFPDAKAIMNEPTWIKRETEWVAGVLGGTHHTPFARIKTATADITADEARAKGYVTGALKKEEVFGLLKRVTTPTTIYKKQKLDRDDIIDITDMNVVAWLKGEMRMMLNEELARAILLGDGREVEDEDKINELNIRPVVKDDDMYAHKVDIDKTDVENLVENFIRARKFYKGTGTPTFYTTTDTLIDMLLLKDKMGRRLYDTEAALASALRVAKIVEVEVMEGYKIDNKELLGVMVNLKDYTVGADKGGEINMFDDFDIDYNQYKYLIETRVSGALTLPKSALVFTHLLGEDEGQ